MKPPLPILVLFTLTGLLACEPPRGDASTGPRIAAAAAPNGAAQAETSGAMSATLAAASVDVPSPAPAASSAASVPVCPDEFTCDYAAWDRAPRPAIDEIFVQKGPHRLHLVAERTILRSYSVALGWGGAGPKKYEGDGVTPVGTYAITDHIDSPWHTFLGVSYPSVQDQREFPLRRARGEVPPGKGIGFGIAIHGHRADQPDGEHKKTDWTLGCIALDNPEIDEVAAVVKRGTRVVITD